MAARVLLIEDDADAGDLLVLLLEASGFDVLLARTTDQGLATLQRHAFDLVLSDFMVDDVDPVASWSRIDAVVERARPTPLGLLTAWAIRDHELAAHGVSFVLRKPLSSDDLLEQLAHWLAVPQLPPGSGRALHEYFACLETARYERLGMLCTEDVVYNLPGASPELGSRIEGREAFVEFSRATFEKFREPKFLVQHVSVLPAGALVRYTGSWLAEGGSRRAMPGAVLFSFRGDLISEIGVRVDVSRLR